MCSAAALSGRGFREFLSRHDLRNYTTECMRGTRQFRFLKKNTARNRLNVRFPTIFFFIYLAVCMCSGIMQSTSAEEQQ